MTHSAINHRPSSQAIVTLLPLSSDKHSNILCPSSIHKQWPHVSSAHLLLLPSHLSSSHFGGTNKQTCLASHCFNSTAWTSEQEFKGKLLMERQRTRWLSLILEDIQQRGDGCAKCKQQEHGNIEKHTDWADINLHETEIMLEYRTSWSRRRRRTERKNNMKKYTGRHSHLTAKLRFLSS